MLGPSRGALGKNPAMVLLLRAETKEKQILRSPGQAHGDQRGGLSVTEGYPAVTGRLARNAMRNRLYTVRLGGYVDFATTKLFVTEKMPETLLARRFAKFLSLSLSTTPSSVTCPFFTIIRMGLMTGMPYFSNPEDP
jgi:hypothetical protein